MPQGMNYSSQQMPIKALPQRLESTAPANPVGGNRAGTSGQIQTTTAQSNRQYQTTQSQQQMGFTDRGFYKKQSNVEEYATQKTA